MIILGIIRLILIFLPYFLVPYFFTKQLINNTKLLPLSFVLTFFTISIYPIFVLWIDRIINPRPPGCVNPEFSLIIGNFFIMVPISLIIQYFILKRLMKKKNKD